MKFIMTKNTEAIKKLYDAGFIRLYETGDGTYLFINDKSKKINFSDLSGVVFTDKIFA